MKLQPCIYRIYDADRTLLYIGSTERFERRMTQHGKNAIWRTQVARIKRTFCADLPQALWREKKAIATEFPRWNITGRSKHHPDGPARFLSDVAKLYPHDLTRPHGVACFEFDMRIQAVLDGFDPNRSDVHESYRQYAIQIYKGELTPKSKAA